MKTEIEVKFLSADFDEVRSKLQSLGAVCEQPMRLMRRAVIDYPDLHMQNEKNAYIRVRDEGDKITLTYKEFKSLSVDGAHEIETTVGSFEDTVSIFEEIGLKVKSFQESKRETWKLGDVEIMLDEWPWLKPYIEIEGESEQLIREVAQKLGFDWSNAVFGDIMAAYRVQYPHLTIDEVISSLPEVRFNLPHPNLLTVK